MLTLKFMLEVILLVNFAIITAEETYFIHGDIVNVVDEKFLSISVDPALLYGFNSSLSMQMVQHLSPAFVRLAGPSTPLFHFSSEQSSGCCSITPWAWKAINFWIKDAHLTPVYLVNSSVLWDSSFMNLLEISSRMKFTSYWQMERDFETNIVQYKQDLLKLKSLIKNTNGETFLKTVGSNALFLTDRSPEMLVKTSAYLTDAVDAVMLEETLKVDLEKSKVPVWLLTPQKAPFLFSSAMNWVNQMEEAAKNGFKVIFKQLLGEELSSETPVYWISLLYKDLIGREVLDVTFNSLPENGVNVFAHCSKKIPGAITVLIINNDSSSSTTSLKVTNSFRNQLVQSYVITFRFKDTFLNGQKLSLEDFNNFKPEMLRLQYTNGYAIESGAKSIGFYTFSDVTIPACLKSEEKSNLKNEELFQEFESRINFHKGLDEDVMLMKPSGMKMKAQKMDSMKQHGLNTDNLIKMTLPKKKLKNTTTLEIVFKERPSKNNTKVVELELTDQEIKKILRDRIESKLAEGTYRIKGRRFEDILKEAARRALKTKRLTTLAQKLKQKMEKREEKVIHTENTINREKTLNKEKTNHLGSKREKRDINMDLLRRKAEKLPRRGEVKATLKRYDHSSEEAFMEGVEDERNPDIYAGMFDSYREDLNCPQAKYVDERLEFLMEPSDVDDFLEQEVEGYHTFHERFEKNSQPSTNDVKATLQKIPEEVVEIKESYTFPGWSSVKTTINSEPAVKIPHLSEGDWFGKTSHKGEKLLKKSYDHEMKSSFLKGESEEAEDLPFDAVFAEELRKLETTPIKALKLGGVPRSLETFHNEEPRFEKFSALKAQEEINTPKKNQLNESEINLKNSSNTFMVNTNNVQEPKTSDSSTMEESLEDTPWYTDILSDWSSKKQSEEEKTQPDEYFCDPEKSLKVKPKVKRDIGLPKIRDRLRTRRLKIPDDEIQGKLKKLRKRRLNKQTLRIKRSVDLYKNMLKKPFLGGTNKENKGHINLRTKKAPSYSVEVIDKQQFRQRTAPFVYHRLRDGKRYPREVDFDSVENMIDDHNFVKVEEMAKYFKDLDEFKFNKKGEDSTGTTATYVTDTDSENSITAGTTLETTKMSEDTTAARKVQTAEETKKPLDIVELIMGVVNATVSEFTHLGEKLFQSFTF